MFFDYVSYVIIILVKKRMHNYLLDSHELSFASISDSYEIIYRIYASIPNSYENILKFILSNIYTIIYDQYLVIYNLEYHKICYRLMLKYMISRLKKLLSRLTKSFNQLTL